MRARPRCVRGGLRAEPGLEVVQQVELHVVDERRVDLVAHAVAVGVACCRSPAAARTCRGSGRRRSRPGWSRGSAPTDRVAAHSTGSVACEAHLGVERADRELADRDRLAVVEERAHAQVRVDALEPRGVDGAVREGGQRPEVEALRLHAHRHLGTRGGDGVVAIAAAPAAPRTRPSRSGVVTRAAASLAASRSARARIARSSVVISSASISWRPSPNRCGASRLSGRVTTSPPKPAEPRGRPWQLGAAVGEAGAERAGLADVAVRRPR